MDHEEMKRAGIDDVGDYGDGPMPAYTRAFRIAGEAVDLESLPALGENDGQGVEAPAPRKVPFTTQLRRGH